MITLLTDVKICPRCKRTLPATADYFYKNRAMKDGLYPQCKKCWGKSRQSKINKDYQQKYRQDHKKEAAKARREYKDTIKGHLHCIFGSMKYRCTDPKAHNYNRYGGRGIKICFEDAAAFANYVINKLQIDPRSLQIDRIDNDGNYEPGNIRFTTHTENQRNKS